MINLKINKINNKIEKNVSEYRNLKLKLDEYKAELNNLKKNDVVQRFMELRNLIEETPKKLMELSNEIAALQYEKEKELNKKSR